MLSNQLIYASLYSAMEANICDINHLDADVLLPPRKRLLAGLKKQNDGRSYMPSTSSAVSQFDSGLNNYLKSHVNNSPDEIVEAARSAAEAAVKVAKAARAAAEEKAVVAAKAMAAAKRALDLVEIFSEETDSDEKYLNNSKIKRHFPGQMLYNKKQRVETDEELARNLHRAINSSPRITKNSSTSELKSHKHKRLMKSLSSSEKLKLGIMQDENLSSTSNGIGTAGEDAGGSTQGKYVVRVDENAMKLNKVDPLKMGNGETVTNHPKGKMEEALDDPFSLGRKRGRIKQKKLPLSICNIRDQVNPNEELKHRSLSVAKQNVSKDTAGNKTLFSVGSSSSTVMPIERTSTWKCKVFKAAACVKQNKVMQS